MFQNQCVKQVRMELIKELLPGSYLLKPKIVSDNRGHFVKTYNVDEYLTYGLEFNLKEEFYSESNKDVLRGMHFQTPDLEHNKLIYCLKGSVIDVVLDLRKKSSSYGQYDTIILNNTNKYVLYIPIGFAHGFLSLEDDSIIVYKTSSVYSQEHDQGIRWDSFGYNWPCDKPIISERDMNHPALSKSWESPF